MGLQGSCLPKFISPIKACGAGDSIKPSVTPLGGTLGSATDKKDQAHAMGGSALIRPLSPIAWAYISYSCFNPAFALLTLGFMLALASQAEGQSCALSLFHS